MFANDEVRLTSIMKSFIKTQYVNFMAKSFISKLLSTFKIVQNNCLDQEEMNMNSKDLHFMLFSE
jgi:hypothetical protein